MKANFFRWSIILFLLLSSPWIYGQLLMYVTSHIAFPVSALLSARSFAVKLLIFGSSGTIGSIITAAVVTLPCVYLARNREKIISTAIVIWTLVFPFCSFFDQPEIKTFTSVVFAVESTTFVIFVFLFTYVVVRRSMGTPLRDHK